MNDPALLFLNMDLAPPFSKVEKIERLLYGKGKDIRKVKKQSIVKRNQNVVSVSDVNLYFRTDDASTGECVIGFGKALCDGM